MFVARQLDDSVFRGRSDDPSRQFCRDFWMYMNEAGGAPDEQPSCGTNPVSPYLRRPRPPPPPTDPDIARRRSPDFPTRVARRHLARGEYDEAERVLARARQTLTDPIDRALVILEEIIVFWKIDDHHRALESAVEYSMLIGRDDGYLSKACLDAALAAGRLSEARRFDEAWGLLERVKWASRQKVLPSGPVEFQIMIAEAAILMDQERWREAIPLLEKLNSRQPPRWSDELSKARKRLAMEERRRRYEESSQKRK